MNKDIRVNVDFLDHPKTVKLKRRLGHAAIISLIRLWTYTAKHRPDGNLSGLDKEDLSIATEWEGNIDELISLLIELNFLEEASANTLTVHEWAEHNGWAANAPQRSQKARKAAEAKWEKQKKKTPKHAPGENEQCSNNASSITQAHAPSPIPSPPPNPKPFYNKNCNSRKTPLSQKHRLNGSTFQNYPKGESY